MITPGLACNCMCVLHGEGSVNPATPTNQTKSSLRRKQKTAARNSAVPGKPNHVQPTECHSTHRRLRDGGWGAPRAIDQDTGRCNEQRIG